MDDKILIHSKDICHHGVDGQRWGKRQYQYADGSLTPLGRVHYGVGEARERSKIKMREIKNETRNAVKLAKAQAKTAKAVAKAESQKLEAETKAYREKAEADNLVKLEKIRSERERDKQEAKIAEQEAKNEEKLNKELAEATKANVEKESKTATAFKVATGILVTAGVGYLLYKACKSGEVSAANREAGERAIEEISSRPVNQVVNSTATEVRNNVTANTHPYGFNNTGPSKWNVDSFTKTRASARQVARENKAAAKAAEAEANKLFRTRASARQVAKENLNPDRYRYSKSPIKKLVEWGTGSKQQYNDILSKGFTPKEAYEMLGQKLPKYLRHSDNGMILIHSAPDVCHYGVKGQKKGIRRYQNADGTLTSDGKIRYGIGNGNISTSNNPDKTVNQMRYNMAHKSITAAFTKPSKVAAAELDEKRKKEFSDLLIKYSNGKATDKDISDFKKKWNFNITKDNIGEYARAYGYNKTESRAKMLKESQNARYNEQNKAYSNQKNNKATSTTIIQTLIKNADKNNIKTIKFNEYKNKKDSSKGRSKNVTGSTTGVTKKEILKTYNKYKKPKQRS